MTQIVADFALKTIRDLLVEEVKFLYGVCSQVKDVQAELQRMQCYLEDVDKRKYEEKTVQNFIKEIKDVCYQIEDVVETYATDVVLKRQCKDICNFLQRVVCLPCEWYSMHEVGSEIHTIKQTMASLRESMKNYGIKEALEKGESDGKGESSRDWGRQTYAHEREKDFVGRGNDVKELGDMFLKEDRVVSIYGMGGLGKTTLAREIFRYVECKYEAFAPRNEIKFAWVCVSKDCKPKNALQDLLKELLKKDEFEGKMIKAMEEDELVKGVNKILAEVGHYFIVLDDIWEKEAWKRISKAIPQANRKILITTRKQEVANIGFRHDLDFLSEDDGWDLLQKKAFTKRAVEDLRVEPNILQRVGKEMVRKCGRLPLAISVVGGILSDKDSFDSWEDVNKDIDVYLRRSEGDRDGEIKQVLSLSYDDLPYHLKPCFLYLSLFREDEDIDAEYLYLLWIAEGIVSPKHQEKDDTLMDVAQRYLVELASRSMVQLEVDKIVKPGKIDSCRLHDLLHDLCLAKSVEEEFLKVMDFRDEKRPTLGPSASNSCLRRLAIYTDKNLESLSQIQTTNQLRSLVLHMPKAMIDFDNLKFLRVLIFQRVNFEGKNLTEVIGKLIHLRLLAFWSCYLKELPSSIGGLPFLQTLVLQFENEVPTIPNILWRIKRLRHLVLPYDFKANAKFSDGKVELGGLDELEMLIEFSSEFCEITDLSKLKNLRCLKARIFGTDNISKFIDIIEVKGNCLETTLQIWGKCDFSSEEGGIVLKKVFMSCSIRAITFYDFESLHTSKLPKYEPGFFPNLTCMVLTGEVLDNDSMSTLENLPKLRILELGYESAEENEIVCHAGGFRQLRDLEFSIFHNLVKWTVEKGAMPCLAKLTLMQCYELEMIPEGLKFITTVQELDIRAMPEEFKNRVKAGGEDFDKVRHVKSIMTRY